MSFVVSSSTMSQSHNRISTQSQSQEQSPLEFETLLRLRPLLKRERDDSVVLEPIPSSGGTYSVVAMHPSPQKDTDFLSPNSGIAAKSPETVQEAHDVEFHFDHILPADATQDKVYFSLGFPMASSVMESLKADPALKNSACRKTHLVVGMGAMGSGKTFTCWGGAPVTKRKSATDGLVPRIVDSLFSQSKHHVNKRSLFFSINISVLQVDQSKNAKSEAADSCMIHDLLQPVAKRSFPPASLSSAASKSPRVQNIVSGFDRTKHSSKAPRSSHISSYSSLDEPVSVEQDPVSYDFHVINGQIRTCRTVEDARDALQVAMANGRKLSSKRYQSHVIVQMQPVLVNRIGKTMRWGGTIAILDMAGMDQSLAPKAHRSAKRIKDSIPNRNDAHSAVLHCLRSLQHNNRVLAGTVPVGDNLSDDESDLSCVSQEKPDYRRQASLKKVPYLQHKVTMLLQPFFSTQFSDKTVVTILLTAYPGHRDYAEKRSLIQEVQSLKTKQAPIPLKATSRKKERPRRERKKNSKFVAASDADDEGSIGFDPPSKVPTEIFKKKRVAPGVENIPSMTYSDSFDNDEEPLVARPPPVAPEHSNPSKSIPKAPTASMSPEASAPLDPTTHAIVPSMAQVPNATRAVPVDFPGVMMPCATAKNNSASDLSSSDDQLQSQRDHTEYQTSSPSEVPSTRFPLRATTATLNIQKPATSSTSSAASLPSYKFSPMKTLNKVVHASKKQGKKVMGKVVAVSSLDKTGDHSASKASTNLNDFTGGGIQDRLSTLEVQNEKLLGENQDLRERNQKLQKENDDLRSMLRKHHIGSSSLLSSSSGQDDSDIRTPHHEQDKGVSREERYGERDLVSDSLMQHMAQVRYQSQNSGRWNIPSSKKPFALQYPPRFAHAKARKERDEGSV